MRVRRTDSASFLEVNQTFFSSVEIALKEATEKKREMDKLKVENVQLAENVAVQLRERDKAHSERVRSLEIVMNEKEKQLLQSSNVMRQQLASAKLESQQLQKQIEVFENKKNRLSNCNLEQELDSMLVVIDMKKEENDQLKAANNSLRLDLERYNGLEIQLQVEKQKVEEMNSVIKMILRLQPTLLANRNWKKFSGTRRIS